MKHLPSYRALRCFEVTVRTRSLSAAAREMNITPGAVSRQISALEERLGTRLVMRHAKGVIATQTGELLAKRLAHAFDAISEAVGEVTHAHNESVVTLNAYPTFAIQWLVPRLPAFQASEPDVDLRLRTSAKENRFDREDIDVAVSIGPATDPRMHSQFLLHRSFSPVCNAATLAGLEPVSLESLQTVRIFYSEMQVVSWELWLRAVGAAPIDLKKNGVRFENSSLAYQAAREGRGLAIGQPALLQNDFETGRLVMPYPQIVESEIAYYVVYRNSDSDRAAVRRFVNWIVNQGST